MYFDDENNNQVDDAAEKKLQEISRAGLNMATKGTWNKVRSMPVVGNKAKNVEDKLANKLGTNRIIQNRLANKNNKQNNPTSHQRPNIGVQSKEEETRSNNPKGNDVGSRNLQKSLSNKAKNLLMQRKGKKKDNSNDTGASDTSNNDSDNNTSSPLDDIIGKSKIRFKIKIIIYSTIFLVLALIIIAIVMAIFGIDITQTIPAINPNTYDTEYF